MRHPEWALKFKEKNTELRCISGRYYLYRISSKWDKERKVTRKITHEMIGRITEQDGLIPRGTKRAKQVAKEPPQTIRSLSTKEYGATSQLQEISQDIVNELKESFPSMWQEILVLALLRLLYQARLKNMHLHYEESFISQQHSGLNLGKNSLTDLMQSLGDNREAISAFMRKFVGGSEHLVFDITDVVSQSKKIKMSAKGYNSHYNFDPQVNLFYMFAIDTQMPVFYRLFPGNISGMKALELSIKEAGALNTLVIGDKGFFCEDNLKMLEEHNVKFILPLRRDSQYIDYHRLSSRIYKQAFDGHFMYCNRPIFYYQMPNYKLLLISKKPEAPVADEAYIYQEHSQWHLMINNTEVILNNKNIIKDLTALAAQLSQESSIITDKALMRQVREFLSKNKIGSFNFDPAKKVILYCDIYLQKEEETSYLARIDQACEGYSIENYQNKQLSFGTISMISNMLASSPQKIYEDFKTRMQIETVFDSYKNLLEADRNYMQSDNAINAWMFINHIAVMIYYKLLNTIKKCDMISQTSPADIITILAKINKVKINDQWYLSEINSKSKKLLDKLDIHVT
jgi:transposase